MSIDQHTTRPRRPTSPAARPVDRPAHALQVGGITPFSASDYPGQLSAVIFVQGCAWRCGYCHNPHLQPRKSAGMSGWQDVLSLLQRRQGLIDAVVFSGGEPTTDPALPQAMRQVRDMGFKVGLHSGGIHPRRLAEVLPLADWVGLDIKAPHNRYDSITRVQGSATPASASLRALLASGKAHECRTTIHPDLLSPADILRLARELADRGVRHYALQVFRPQGCTDFALNATQTAGYPGQDILAQVAALFPHFTLRTQ